MSTNTDLICQLGNVFTNIRISITRVTNGVEDHAALQQIQPAGGLIGDNSNNNGGRYGWLSWGKAVSGTPYWEHTVPINYYNQTFNPPDKTYTCCRIWLKFNVQADIYVNNISGWILVVDKYVQQLLPLLKPGGKLPGKQLPAPIPGH